MARFMSLAVAFGESDARRLLSEALFTEKSGDWAKALWVAFDVNSQASLPCLRCW